MRRLEPDQEISDHLESNTHQGKPVALGFRCLRRPFAQQKDPCEEEPAQNDTAKSDQRERGGLEHKRHLETAEVI